MEKAQEERDLKCCCLSALGRRKLPCLSAACGADVRGAAAWPGSGDPGSAARSVRGCRGERPGAAGISGLKLIAQA